MRLGRTITGQTTHLPHRQDSALKVTSSRPGSTERAFRGVHRQAADPILARAKSTDGGLTTFAFRQLGDGLAKLVGKFPHAISETARL